jgi:hypothetical protein
LVCTARARGRACPRTFRAERASAAKAAAAKRAGAHESPNPTSLKARKVSMETDTVTAEQNLPAIIDRASARLMAARNSAEVLEAKALCRGRLHYAKVTKAANEAHADCLRVIARSEIRGIRTQMHQNRQVSFKKNIRPECLA